MWFPSVPILSPSSQYSLKFLHPVFPSAWSSASCGRCIEGPPKRRFATGLTHIQGQVLFYLIKDLQFTFSRVPEAAPAAEGVSRDLHRQDLVPAGDFHHLLFPPQSIEFGISRRSWASSVFSEVRFLGGASVHSVIPHPTSIPGLCPRLGVLPPYRPHLTIPSPSAAPVTHPS